MFIIPTPAPFVKGGLFVDFSPRLLYNNLIKQGRSNCMATEKDIKAYQQALLYELRRLFEKTGKDFTNEEILKFLDTVAEAKAQE